VLKIGLVDESTQESCARIAEACMHRDILWAVSRELQLKFQDAKIAVTNWDRIRLNPTPNYSV